MDEKGDDDDEEKEKDYVEHDQGGDDESERLFCSQRFIEGKHSMSDY